MSSALDRSLMENLDLTEEVAINGIVLNIGGVEKSSGASKVGIKTLCVPYVNRFDLLNLPDHIKNSIRQVFFGQNCEEVYRIGFGLDTCDIQYNSQNEEIINFEEIVIENNLINKIF